MRESGCTARSGRAASWRGRAPQHRIQYGRRKHRFSAPTKCTALAWVVSIAVGSFAIRRACDRTGKDVNCSSTLDPRPACEPRARDIPVSPGVLVFRASRGCWKSYTVLARVPRALSPEQVCSHQKIPGRAPAAASSTRSPVESIARWYHRYLRIRRNGTARFENYFNNTRYKSQSDSCNRAMTARSKQTRQSRKSPHAAIVLGAVREARSRCSTFAFGNYPWPLA
jgi:hypothetical protein